VARVLAGDDPANLWFWPTPGGPCRIQIATRFGGRGGATACRGRGLRPAQRTPRLCVVAFPIGQGRASPARAPAASNANRSLTTVGSSGSRQGVRSMGDNPASRTRRNRFVARVQGRNRPTFSDRGDSFPVVLSPREQRLSWQPVLRLSGLRRPPRSGGARWKVSTSRWRWGRSATTFDTISTLKRSRMLQLRPSPPGRIERLLVRFRGSVQQGQLLLVLEQARCVRCGELDR